MKNLINVVKGAVYCLSIGFLVHSLPSYGASLEFTPSGSQLDEDTIFDINANRGDTITFNIQVDTTGLNRNLVELAYSVAVDRGELRNPNFQGNQNLFLSPRINGSLERGNIDVTQNAQTEGLVSATRGVAPGQLNISVATASFRANPGITPHDGASDFTVTLIRAITGEFDNNGRIIPGSLNNVTSMFTPVSQTVEVQTPQTVPEPLTIFSSAIALIFGVVLNNQKAKFKNYKM